MPVLDDDLFLQAQRYDRDALEKFLTILYLPVQRMAYGLSGRDDVGRGVVRFMMKQGLSHLSLWRDAAMAQRWFYHHTILTTRRAARHQPTPKQEVLLQGPQKPDPAYEAYIRVLRGLPYQQREAFILHHGEKLDLRQIAIAMDCSTHAAQLHLQAAKDVLAPLAGDAFAALTDRLAQAYQRLTPAPDLIRLPIQRYVARSLWPRRIKRILATLLLLAALIAGYYLWHRYGHALPWPQTQPR